MNWETTAVLPSSAMAAVSTLHLALVLVRKHRSALRSWIHPALLLSFGFVALPWILPRPRQVAIGAGAHLLWFLLCELFLRPRAAASPSANARLTVVRPLSAGQPAAAAPRPPAPAASTAKPSGFVAAPVLAVFDETKDIRTFRMARPEGFDFLAGQFLTVGVEVNGQKLPRCYSISSAPESAGYLEISVKRQGLVSGALHATVRPGTFLSIRPPAGRFVYPEADSRPLVLLAGGVGSTPLVSMLRHAVASEPSRLVTYLLSVRTEADIAFRQELALIARRHPQVRIVVALTGGSSGPGFYAGRIDETLLRRTVPDPVHSVFCICGPIPMIDGLKALLHSMGVPPQQVRSEAFGAAVAASSIPESAPEVVAARQRRSAKRAGGAASKAGFALCLARSGRTVAVAGGQTLLEAAEAADVEIPSSCRAGVCGTCRTRLVEGDVDCDGDALDPADREKGYILPCVAWARGDCALEA